MGLRERGPKWVGAMRTFYEKALFVKVDMAAALWLTLLLCPSRYASIRCEYAIGGCGRRSRRVLTRRGLTHLFADPKVP